MLVVDRVGRVVELHVETADADPLARRQETAPDGEAVRRRRRRDILAPEHLRLERRPLLVRPFDRDDALVYVVRDGAERLAE